MELPAGRMPSTHSPFLIFFLLFISMSVAASPCTEQVECDKCAAPSEFSWNPDNTFVTPRLAQFYKQDELMEAAFSNGDYQKATQIANEYLTLASVYRCNWNYGNAIHDANRALGLISFKSGNVEEAQRFLIKSGKSTGSPQLNTFGPTLDLANALLKAGAKDSVTTYLRNVSTFWKMDNGYIDKWVSAIERNEEITLDRSEANAPNPILVAFLYVLVAWPIAVTAATLLIKKKELNSKLRFLVINVIAGYTAMWLMNLVPDSAQQSAFSEYGTTAVAIVLCIASMSLPIVSTLIVLRIMRNRPTSSSV